MTTMHARFKREVEHKLTQAACSRYCSSRALTERAAPGHRVSRAYVQGRRAMGHLFAKVAPCPVRPVAQGQTGEAAAWRSRIIDAIRNWMRPTDVKVMRTVQSAE